LDDRDLEVSELRGSYNLPYQNLAETLIFSKISSWRVIVQLPPAFTRETSP